MAEAVLHDCETQKNEISDQLKTPLKKGDTWYVLSVHSNTGIKRTMFVRL